MKQYEKYKPSGIEWLGEIPEHWEVKRVKDVTNYVKTGTTPAASKGDFFTDGTEIWFTPSDINNGNIENSNRKVTISAFEERELTFFPENSVYLIGIGGTQGKVAICSIKASCNQQINVLVGSRLVFPRFLFYQLVVTGSTLLKWSNYTTMPIFTQSDTKYLGFILPQYSEQTAIANHLDTKTAAIDRKIELLTAKADKYKALRRSLINETVCRGLNPNAPLKDSGIEWVGMIPVHWEEYRMKDLGFLYSGLSGKAGDDFNQDENENNCDFIPFTNIFNNDTINPEVMGKVVVFENEKQNKVKKNDLFFLMSSEDYDGLGKSSLLSVDLKNTYLNSFCKGFRITRKKVLPAFLNYQLQSDTFRKILLIEGKGFTRMNLKMEKVNDFTIYIPNTIEEQNEIVKYLNEKNTQIDTILTNISEQINKLTQLRKTLINDVVTGNIKVTE